MKLSSLALAFLLTAATTSRPSEVGRRIAAPVSVLQLVAVPEKYDGKSVSVVGYLELQVENDVIYLHREDRDFGLYANSLRVEFEPKLTEKEKSMCNLHYVYVRGKFDANDKGPHSDMGGSIKQAEAILVWPGPRPQPVTSPD
jgi:hypothetical protein